MSYLDPTDSNGDYEGAIRALGDTLSVWERSLGPDHPNTAKSLNNLGILYENKRDYQQALDLFRRALAAEDQAFNDIFAVASEEQKLLFAQGNQGSQQMMLMKTATSVTALAVLALWFHFR